MSKVRELKDKIKDLERDARYRVLTNALQVKEAEFQERQKYFAASQDSRILNATLSARLDEMEKQDNAGAYKQLSDILKALVVKLPSLNIKEIHCKEK